MNAKASNPLNVSEKLIEKSLKSFPPREIEGARWLGRELIPTSFVRYSYEEQTRDKANDVQALNDLTNDFKVNGILLGEPVPIAAYNPQFPHMPDGLAGYHRGQVFQNLQQEVYMYDIYDFDPIHADFNKEVIRNTSNHHRGAFKTQTKLDYIKVVSNALANNLIEKREDAIVAFVEKICDKTSAVKEKIVKEAISHSDIYSNFITYSSQRSSKNKNSLVGYLRDQGFPPAGIEHRTREEIERQGYIVYCAASGSNQSTWARAITNSMKYGVPVYVLGYAPTRVEDLSEFRKIWIEEFNCQKDIMIDFVMSVIQDDVAIIDDEKFPVKFGGFLPQYVKANPKDKGAPTEVGTVDRNGKTIDFHKNMDCLAWPEKGDTVAA